MSKTYFKKTKKSRNVIIRTCGHIRPARIQITLSTRHLLRNLLKHLVWKLSRLLACRCRSQLYGRVDLDQSNKLFFDLLGPQLEETYATRPWKTQISLRICTVWSESSLSAWRNFASLGIQNTPSDYYFPVSRKMFKTMSSFRTHAHRKRI